MSTDVLSSIQQQTEANSAKERREYAELAAAIASGDQIKPQQAAALLERQGRTPEQLQQDVADLQLRQQLQDRLGDIDARTRELEAAAREGVEQERRAQEQLQQARGERSQRQWALRTYSQDAAQLQQLLSSLTQRGLQ